MTTTSRATGPATPAASAIGYRTYEVFQRERVGQSTAKITPRQLMSPAFVHDPYPTLAILREDYPCYRDWIGNAFWITRYDDVTSVFMDDANYETRSKLWRYGREGFGRDLRDELPVLTACASRIDAQAPAIAERIIGSFAGAGTADLALDLGARLPLELLASQLDLPAEDVPLFAERYVRMQRGATWEPEAAQRGLAAMGELTAYFAPWLERRRADPGDDLVSAIASLDVDGGPTRAEDVVATLLEDDHETLHGALANVWYLLLTHPDQLEEVTADRRLMRYAYLETLRHSPPVLAAARYARNEVERFGRLLPEGALVWCSAAAANRDPRTFGDPDHFVVTRKDLCQREPRGTYRADGLPSGIAFGLGQPSRHPAVPEDRPRSRYAITRDVVVLVSKLLLDACAGLRLEPGVQPELRSLRLGEVHTCWHLPVRFTPA